MPPIRNAAQNGVWVRGTSIDICFYAVTFHANDSVAEPSAWLLAVADLSIGLSKRIGCSMIWIYSPSFNPCKSLGTNLPSFRSSSPSNQISPPP